MYYEGRQEAKLIEQVRQHYHDGVFYDVAHRSAFTQ